MKPEPKPKSIVKRVLDAIVYVTIVLVVLGVALGPTTPPAPYTPALMSSSRQTARIIGLALFSYANDNGGHYPEGKTSTEVFQQLIDGSYVTDSAIFYERIPGKVRPQSNHLKAENVSWDVTCCVDLSAPDGLPLVFRTGYKVTYQAGAPAMLIRPLHSPPPPKNWSERIFGVLLPYPYMAVFYKNNSTVATKTEDDLIPNFIPADFDPKGKTYRQLTP